MTLKPKPQAGRNLGKQRLAAGHLTDAAPKAHTQKDTLTEKLDRKRPEGAQRNLTDDATIRDEITRFADQGLKKAKRLNGLQLAWLRDVFRVAANIDVLAGHLKHEPLAPAPENDRYENREHRRETAPEFIRRLYGPRLDGSFSRAALGTIDDSAIKGLRDWESRNKPLSLDELNLPTIDDVNTRKLAIIQLDEGLFAEVGRLANVHRARKLRKQ